MKCKAVRQCWRELGLEQVRLRLVQTRSAEEFVLDVPQLRTDICLRVVVLLWRWWDCEKKSEHGLAHAVLPGDCKGSALHGE